MVGERPVLRKDSLATESGEEWGEVKWKQGDQLVGWNHGPPKHDGVWVKAVEHREAHKFNTCFRSSCNRTLED